jgi:hypothetical protein
MTRADPIAVFKGNLAPDKKMDLPTWAERSIYLSPRQATGFPGYYRTALTPYIKGIFEALTDPNINKVTVEKGAQTGGTLAGYIWILYCIVRKPGPCLFVYPSENIARSKSETAFMPMAEDSPVVREEKPDNPDDWTKLQQQFKRCTVNWVGSNSPANLASRAVRYLFLDEVDKYPCDNQTEASPISLAEQRTKTFRSLRKIFKISTPTTQDGAIHADYMAGDQRRFFVPCPHCGAMQFLKWAQVRWPEGKPEEAQYVCEVCQKPWTDAQRNAAVFRGEWRATAKSKDSHAVSFHLSSLYSRWTNYRALAAKFLRTKTLANELQDFVNSELGEPFVHFDNSIRDTVFAELEGQYDEGQAFSQVEPYKKFYLGKQTYVFGGCDVQKGYLVPVFREFVTGGDSALLWAGEVPNLESLEERASLYKAEFVFVDSRYRTQEINEWCAAHIGYLPAMGVTRKGKTIFWTDMINIDEGKANAKKGRVIEGVSHNPDALKDVLADQIQKTQRSKVWLVPRGYATRSDYCAQMTAEKSVNGKWIAVPAGRPNHYWDAECLCLLAAWKNQVFQILDKPE